MNFLPEINRLYCLMTSCDVRRFDGKFLPGSARAKNKGVLDTCLFLIINQVFEFFIRGLNLEFMSAFLYHEDEK